ncbi:MAG: ISL3 family transposase [Acidobacteriota bacterium]|nr:ISL3 family transposase [Acidobacteriota bacterium]
MNELSLFTLALGLTDPWQVSDIKFSKEEGRLDLRIDFAKGAKFPCPSCQETKEGEVHDTLDRTWRHLNFFQYETYLHARVPRIRCGTCGVKQVDVPWARPGSGFTLLFELLVLSLCREMSVAAVADLTKEHANRLWRILNHYVERARQAVDLSGFHQLGIDEFSIRKGHVYMTSFGDLEASRVIFLGEGRKKGVVEAFIEDLRLRGIDPGRIDVICCDMWDPYLNGIGTFLSKAVVVFDRFHVMNQINKALEAVRREEQRENAVLKNSRFLWLKNPKNLTTRQEARLAELKRLDLRTARAYQIKLALARFWEIADPGDAVAYLKRWCFWATHSWLQPVIQAARTIKRYWKGVVNFFNVRVTNGMVEGLNSKIKTAMKRAYGFKHVAYLRTIIYLVAGKLTFDYPQ